MLRDKYLIGIVHPLKNINTDFFNERGVFIQAILLYKLKKKKTFILKSYDFVQKYLSQKHDKIKSLSNNYFVKHTYNYFFETLQDFLLLQSD